MPKARSTMKYNALVIISLVATVIRLSAAFSPRNHRVTAPPPTTSRMVLHMGMFDGFKKAFTNEEYGSPPDSIKATARHILVKTPEEAKTVMEKLAGGAAFGSLASEYSTCPSGARGGSLGSFQPGTMVKEFDSAIFSPDVVVGDLIGPVETEFGYHLIVVDKRTGGGDWY